MQDSRTINLLILLSAIIMLCTFWWLFDLAIPEASLPFAIGVTTIIMSGLLSGRYISRLAFNLKERVVKILMGALFASAITGGVVIGWLVNRMIGDTQFFHFLVTIILLFLVSGFVGAVIRLIRHSINTRLREAELAATQSRSELQLLQSQLSPHFLFNTLNNLYGLSLSNNQKLPELLLKLSELLRYSVYETKELFVDLQQEIGYLNNYIAFEKIRLDERLHLESDLEKVQGSSWQISPMLLIVFVENAFKHARNSKVGKVHIAIALNVNRDSLHFSIKNSRDSSGEKGLTREKHSGFGLESVEKRLELLYKNKHELTIDQLEGSFEVYLILKR